MRPDDQLKLGEWNAICDICGQKFKSSQLRKRWDGYMVCREDYEQRHPQDFLRSRADRQLTPWVRPEPTDRFAAPAPANPDTL